MTKAASLTSALSAALTLLAMQTSVRATQMAPALEHKPDKLEKCYGVNAASKNDCATVAHGCATEATMARDPKSYVLLPAGDCGKIAGGTTSPKAD